MKSILIVFLFFNCSITSIAQTDSLQTITWKKGINFSFIANDYYLTMTPSISVTKGPHYFSLGPQINFDQSRNYNFYGLEFNYRIRPHDLHKRFNFFFFNLTQINADKYEGSYTVYNSSLSNSYIIDQKSTSRSILSYIGYGIDFRFWNRIHINQFLGIGLVSHKYHMTQNVSSNMAMNEDYSNQYLEPTVMINFGIGFDF